MAKLKNKIRIQEKVIGSLTAHLMPLIEFIKAQGNPPVPPPSYAQLNEDGFRFDRDGLGTFLFQEPLDVAAIQARFELPPTIVFITDGDIWDRRSRVGIQRGRPVTEADLIFDWD